MTPALSDLERSWVVEASAGTGKTTALVERIVEVIAAGHAGGNDRGGHLHARRCRQYETARPP